jgi:hypothetical protein
MRAGIYTELYLWNKSIDSLTRVLQRLELLGICPKRFFKTHEMSLEALRARLNSDLLEAMLLREQDAEARLRQLVPVRSENTIKNNSTDARTVNAP